MLNNNARSGHTQRIKYPQFEISTLLIVSHGVLCVYIIIEKCAQGWQRDTTSGKPRF